MIDPLKLPPFIRGDIYSFIQDNKLPLDIVNLSPRDIVDYWLQWNGIIGYTDNIINLVDAAFSAETRESILRRNDYDQPV